MKLLYLSTHARHEIYIDPIFIVDSHWAWRNLAELTNIVFMQDDRYSWTEVGAEPGVIAAAVPGRGLIFLFPVLF
jgi:hypothetical protein